MSATARPGRKLQENQANQQQHGEMLRQRSRHFVVVSKIKENLEAKHTIVSKIKENAKHDGETFVER